MESLDQPVVKPDCMAFECQDICCSHGAEAFVQERDALIAHGWAALEEFTPTWVDEVGDEMCRTMTQDGMCVFRRPNVRGCRLHESGLKPKACCAFPDDWEESTSMHAEGCLPCWNGILWGPL